MDHHGSCVRRVHDTGGLVGIKVLVPHTGEVVAFDAEEQRYVVHFVTGLVMRLPRDEVLNLNQMSMVMLATPVVQHPLVGTFVVKCFGTTLVRGVVQQHVSQWNVFEVAYDNGLREHVSEDYIRANPFEPVVVKVEPRSDCIDLTLSDDETPIKAEQPPPLPPSLAPLYVLPHAPVAYKPSPTTPVANVARAAPSTAPPVADAASPAPATDVTPPEHRVVEWSGSESDVSPPPKLFTRLTKAKPRRLKKGGLSQPPPSPKYESPQTRDASSSEVENTSQQGASSSSSDDEARDPRAIKDELAAKLLQPIDKNRRTHCHVRHKKDQRPKMATMAFIETEAKDAARARRQRKPKRSEFTPPSSPVSEPKRHKKSASASVPEPIRVVRPRSNVRQLKTRPVDASPQASKPRRDVMSRLVSSRDMDVGFTIPKKQASNKPAMIQEVNSRSNSKYIANIFNPPNAIRQRPTHHARAPREASTHNQKRSSSPRTMPMPQKKTPATLPAGWGMPSNTSNQTTTSRTTSSASSQPSVIPRAPVLSKRVVNFTAQARMVNSGLKPDYELKKAALAAERLKMAEMASASSDGFFALGRKHQPSTKIVQRRPSKDDVTFAVPTTPPESEPQRYLARDPPPPTTNEKGVWC